MATHKPIAPTGHAYALAHEVAGAARLLFVSGQVPEDEHGNVPDDFAGQCRLAWENVRRQLAAAGLSFDHLVKVTIFLSDRAYRADNARIRREVLQDRSPALTIIITGIYEERWLLEIEAIAAA
jgi:enamine deaminase RidA (YjgF/YER057c/UK114 family)